MKPAWLWTSRDYETAALWLLLSAPSMVPLGDASDVSPAQIADGLADWSDEEEAICQD